MNSDQVGIVRPDVRIVRVEVARRGQHEIARRAAGVLIEALDSGPVHAGRRSRPCHQRRVVVVIRVDAKTRNLRIGEAGDLRIRDVDRRACRVEPTGEL